MPCSRYHTPCSKNADLLVRLSNLRQLTYKIRMQQYILLKAAFTDAHPEQQTSPCFSVSAEAWPVNEHSIMTGPVSLEYTSCEKDRIWCSIH
jgi:hypothetical protein